MHWRASLKIFAEDKTMTNFTDISIEIYQLAHVLVSIPFESQVMFYRKLRVGTLRSYRDLKSENMQLKYLLSALKISCC